MTSFHRWAAALAGAALAASAVASPVELTVSVFAPLDEAVKAAIPAFERAHPDIRVKLRSLKYGEYKKDMGQALRSGEGLPDVMALELGFATSFAASGQLRDLTRPPYDVVPRLQELLAFPLSHVTIGKQLYGLPVDTGPGVLFYRKDVLDRAGVSEADLTRSWEDFFVAARKVKKATGSSLIADVTQIYEIEIRNGLAKGEGIFFDKDGRSVVQGPRFQRAFALARVAQAEGVGAGVDLWSNEWVDGVRSGRIAAQPFGAWMGWHLERWLAPDARGLFRAAPLPGGRQGAWGGAFWSIPEKSAHPREAWQLVQFLCFDRDQQLRAFTLTGGWPALRAVQSATIMDEPLPYFGGQRARQVWRDAAAHIPYIPGTLADGDANAILFRQLREVLTGKKDVQRALADAQAELDKTLEQALTTPPAAKGEPAEQGGRIELTVASYPSQEEAVKLAAARFEEDHPEVHVKLVSRPFSDHYKAMLDALEKGTDVPDVLGLDLEWTARLFETGALEDLAADPWNARSYTGQVLPYAVAEVEWKGTLPAFPGAVGPGTLLYRKDLLDRAGVKEADLTRSWDSFLLAGQKVKAKTGVALLPHVRDLVDAYVRAGLPSGGGVYFDEQGEPVVTSARFRAAFELARRARKAGLDVKARTWSKEWGEALEKGRVAAVMHGAWLTPHLEKWLDPEGRGQWRATTIPGGAPLDYGGTFWAIPRGAAHKEQAWAFVQFLCLDRGQQLDVFHKFDAWPALADAQDDEYVDEPVGYLGGQRARRIWKDVAGRVPTLQRHPQDALAGFLLMDALDDVVERGRDVGEALASVQAQLRKRAKK